MIAPRLQLSLVLALSGLGGADPGVAAAAPGTQTVRVGVATLTVPAGWRPAGATAFAPAPGLPDRAIVSLSPAADRSLVPPSMRRLAGNGKPRNVRLAGYRAWRYAGPAADVTVLPSAAGVLAIVCRSPLARRSACAAAVTHVSLGRAAVLTPSPDLALQLRLTDVLAPLDHARVSGRLALRRATRGPAQAQQARALATAHRRALRELRPLAVPAQHPLIAALADAADAYLTLAGATTGSRARYRAARAAVARSDARLTAVVGRATRVVPHAQPTAATPSTGSRGPSRLLLGLATLALLAGALQLRRRHPTSPANPAPVAPPPARRFVPRHYPPPSRPAPPPPASGTGWDGSPVAERA